MCFAQKSAAARPICLQQIRLNDAIYTPLSPRINEMLTFDYDKENIMFRTEKHLGEMLTFNYGHAKPNHVGKNL